MKDSWYSVWQGPGPLLRKLQAGSRITDKLAPKGDSQAVTAIVRQAAH